MDRPLFGSWEGTGRPPLVTDGGEAGAGGDHSRAALALALSLGADGAALSVRLSSDGVPVLFRLPRTGGSARGNLPVARTPASELRSLRLKGDEPPLFLEEALSLLPPALPTLLVLLVPGTAAAVAPLLAPFPAAGRPAALVSPLREELLAAERILPAVPRILATVRPSLSDGEFCAGRSVGLLAAASSLTPVRCGRLAREGVPLLARGAESALLCERAASLGAFALLTRHLRRLLPRGVPAEPSP